PRRGREAQAPRAAPGSPPCLPWFCVAIESASSKSWQSDATVPQCCGDPLLPAVGHISVKGERLDYVPSAGLVLGQCLLRHVEDADLHQPSLGSLQEVQPSLPVGVAKTRGLELPASN